MLHRIILASILTLILLSGCSSDFLKTPPTLVGDNFAFTEGPLWIKDRKIWLFTDIPSNKVYSLNLEGEVSIFDEDSGYANGLAIDKSKINVLIILPNNDAGFSEIIKELKNSKINYVESLGISDYINLLKRSSGLIGNSSSGIHETSTFNIPTVNIGSRQKGRLRPKNVFDVDHNEKQIILAINKCIEFNQNKIKVKNPYGDGKSASRIIEIIKKIDLSNRIIQKTITY